MNKDSLLPKISESYEIAITRNRVTGWIDLSPRAKLFSLEYSKECDLAKAASLVKITKFRAEKAIKNPLILAYINSLIGEEAATTVITREFLEYHMLITLGQVNGDVEIPLLTKDGTISGKSFNASSKIRLLKQMEDYLEVRSVASSQVPMLAKIQPGQVREFDSSDELWKACVEYFQWVEDNPIFEIRVEYKAGKEQEIKTPRPRIPTEGSLVIFIGTRLDIWCGWALDPETHPKFAAVIEVAREVIQEVKMSNAAANTMNSNFIARDLGLADKREHIGPGGGPLRMITSGMTAKEAAEAYADMLKGDGD